MRQIRGGTHDSPPIVEMGPCRDCPHKARCAAELEACRQFMVFWQFGGDIRWRSATRQPTHEAYLRLFP